MSILVRMRKYLRPWIEKKEITIGDKRYVRQQFFPNPLASTTKHECWLDDIYENVLDQKQGAFVDVGVNIGQTLLKILQIDGDRQYVGFEPQIAPSFSVEHFLVENRLSNHIIIPIGLSNKHGLVKLKIRGQGFRSLLSGTASIIDKFRSDDFYTYSKYIYTAPGDEIIPYLNLHSIAMIKIDVEGAELVHCVTNY